MRPRSRKPTTSCVAGMKPNANRHVTAQIDNQCKWMSTVTKL